MATLHYIYDPYCGWCYGAAPLLKAASELPGIQIELHAGGMIAQAQKITAEFRAMILHHDQRIAAMSGQTFGEAYRAGLLNDSTAVFDSIPPITAILAAGQFGRDYEMLQRIQTAQFIEGRKISSATVLADLAEEIGINREGFEKASGELAGQQTALHVAESRQRLGEAGGSGFPTFVLESGGLSTRLDHGPYLGKTAAWAKQIEDLLGQAVST